VAAAIVHLKWKFLKVYVSLKMHIITLVGDNLLVPKDTTDLHDSKETKDHVSDRSKATETVSISRMEISKNI
jgi:hypothetical protein